MWCKSYVFKFDGRLGDLRPFKVAFQQQLFNVLFLLLHSFLHKHIRTYSVHKYIHSVQTARTLVASRQSWALRPQSYDMTGLRPASVLVLHVYSLGLCFYMFVFTFCVFFLCVQPAVVVLLCMYCVFCVRLTHSIKDCCCCYTFGLGLGLAALVLVLVLYFWSCFQHCCARQDAVWHDNAEM